MAAFLHPKDLSVALSHPDQWCPFLLSETNKLTDNKPDPLSYQDFQEGIFRFPVLEYWAGNFPGWTVEVHVRSWPDRCGHEVWRVSVFGTDDRMLGISLASHEEARRLILSFPPYLSKPWLFWKGFDDNGHTCRTCHPKEKYPFAVLRI